MGYAQNYDLKSESKIQQPARTVRVDHSRMRCFVLGEAEHVERPCRAGLANAQDGIVGREALRQDQVGGSQGARERVVGTANEEYRAAISVRDGSERGQARRSVSQWLLQLRGKLGRKRRTLRRYTDAGPQTS